MAIFNAPRITTVDRSTLTPTPSEILYDIDKKAFYGGDGSTLGGFLIGSTGFGSDYIVEQQVLTTQDILNKNITLINTPSDPSFVTVTIKNGISQVNGVDFNISGNILNWNGLGLDGFLEEGDTLIVEYSTMQPSGITIQTITLTSQHLVNKYVTLVQTPQNPMDVTLDIKGGIPQLNGEDFVVLGNALSWNGLGLDGFLEIGDVLIIEF
jgi:hypothetical protein